MAAPTCLYDAPIAPAELQHEGFGVPPSQFTFSWKFNGRNSTIHLYKINDEYVDTRTLRKFNPEAYYKNPPVNLDAFNVHVNNVANLHPLIDAIAAMDLINKLPISIGTGHVYASYECAALQHSPFNMFCRQSLDSLLRMKLFCAFGMLHNFVNQSKVELLVRGGMALRLQLDPTSELISTAPDTDVDGLVVVDPSIGAAELDQFKTTIMKLLVLSIKSSIPPNATLICKPAGGDSKNTIKVLVKTAVTEYELCDIGFKVKGDPIVKMYEKHVSIMTPEGMRDVNGIFPMTLNVYGNFLPFPFPCMWKFPNIQNMKSEYEHVVGNLRKEIATIEETKKSKSPESRLFDDDSPFDDDVKLRNLDRNMFKFETKSEIAERRYGGKKRTIKRRVSGGSTTEQIGAAAQMRAFLPRHSATRNALNHIVHHESKNRFHDANYRHSPATQAAINRAFRAINANPRVSRRTKKHMKIAKQKASTHRR